LTEAGETFGRSGRLGNARQVRLAAIAMAAALAGAGIYPNFAHPFGNWLQQRLPAIARIGPARSSGKWSLRFQMPKERGSRPLPKGRFEWNREPRQPESRARRLYAGNRSQSERCHAYAGLADTYEMLFIRSRQDDDARDRAMAAARKAVETDSSLSEAHRALDMRCGETATLARQKRNSIWLSSLIQGSPGALVALQRSCESG